MSSFSCLVLPGATAGKKKTFFDDVGFWKHPRTWTGAFNKKFAAINGYDPKPWYPALWY